jgi:hypothetical protein
MLALISPYMYNAKVGPMPKTFETTLPKPYACHLSSSVLLGGIRVVPLLLVGLGILQEFPKSNQKVFPELEGTEDSKWSLVGLNVLDERLLVWTLGVDRRSLSLLRG